MFDFAGNFFLIIFLLGWVRLSTRASRLLHKCHENFAICVLKLVVADCCLVSINVATGVSLVNIRLLSFQHQVTSNFYATGSYELNQDGQLIRVVGHFEKATFWWRAMRPQ